MHRPPAILLAEMRGPARQVCYLVGTPRSKIKQHEKKWLDLPWRKVRDSVEVKLFEQDGELYVLAKSQGRQAKEMAMRRKRLARLLRKLRAMRRSLPTRDQLLMRIGAAKTEAGRAFGFVKMTAPEAQQRVTRQSFQFCVDKGKLKEAELRDGHYLLRSNLTGGDPAVLWTRYVQLTQIGGDTYGPEYFDRETGGKRWEFYRPSTRSHNTLVVDGLNQDPLAPAPVIEQTLAGATPIVRIDLSRVNPGVIRSWIRTVTLPERSRVVLDDELVASRPVQVVWGMLTPAQIVLDGAVARLRKGGQSLTVRALQPAGARFEVESTQPPPPQNPNAGTRRLILRLPEKVEKVRLVVELTPVQ